MTTKDAYYFPHDSNAKDDPKIVMLIEQLGLEGYGIYWILIETLRDQPEYRYPIKLLPAMARRYNTTHEKMRAVVMSYNLFGIENEEFFFSESLINRMLPLDRKKLQAANAATVRWQKEKKMLKQSKRNASAMRPHSVSNAIREEEKRKEESINEQRQPDFNYEAVVDYYNKKCTGLPQVRQLTKKRIGYINARLKDYKKEDMVAVINKAANSNFLNGHNERQWRADFDWLMSPIKFLHVLEGKFDDAKLNNKPEIKMPAGSFENDFKL